MLPSDENGGFAVECDADGTRKTSPPPSAKPPFLSEHAINVVWDPSSRCTRGILRRRHSATTSSGHLFFACLYTSQRCWLIWRFECVGSQIAVQAAGFSAHHLLRCSSREVGTACAAPPHLAVDLGLEAADARAQRAQHRRVEHIITWAALQDLGRGELQAGHACCREPARLPGVAQRRAKLARDAERLAARGARAQARWELACLVQE